MKQQDLGNFNSALINLVTISVKQLIMLEKKPSSRTMALTRRATCPFEQHIAFATGHTCWPNATIEMPSSLNTVSCSSDWACKIMLSNNMTNAPATTNALIAVPFDISTFWTTDLQIGAIVLVRSR